MLILDKKIVRPGGVEMSSIQVRWVVYGHEKEILRGAMEELPRSQKIFLPLEKP